MFKKLLAFLLIPAYAFAGTVTGVIATATGGPQKNVTLTLQLNAPNTLAGSFAVSTSPISCYTDALGNVVGVPNPLVPPVLSQNTASGTLPAATYFVKITYAGAGGESVASPEGSFTVTATGTLIVTAPTRQPASATGYNVYISTSSGTETKQGTVTGFANYSQSSPLVAGSALPASNSSICSFTFNDSYLAQPNWYLVSVTSSTGQTISGISRTGKAYFAGGANGTVNISNGLPDFNGLGVWPTPILSSPAAGAQQTINGSLLITANLSVGGSASATNLTASSLVTGNCVQATTGGLLVTVSGPCGTSSGTITATGSPVSGQGTFFSGATSITGSANWTYAAASGHSITQGANGTDALYMNRFTDTSPTGNFLHFQNNAKNTDLFTVNSTGSVFSNNVVNAVVGYQQNGAATTGNVLRGNGTNFVNATLAAADLSNGVTGSGAVVLATSPGITTPNIVTGFTIGGGATAGNVARGNGTNFVSATLAAADLSNGVTGSGAVVLATSPAIGSPSTTGTDSGTETLQNKRVTPRAVAVADATSITPNSDTSDIVTQTNTQAGGTLTINAPTGTPTDGQKLIIRVKTSNVQNYSFNATYHFSTTVAAPASTAIGKTDYIGCMWNATNSAWDVVAVDQGH